MKDRPVARLVAERLGADAAHRLVVLRRRLWRRRALRLAGPWLAAGLLAGAGVQLAARSTPLELAPLLFVFVAGAAAIGWAIHAWLRRPSLLEAARRADA